MEILKMGYCGDICEICPRYTATQSGDEKRLKEVADMWLMIGWRDTVVPPEELTCNGCESLEICELGIRDCVLEKGLDSCGECFEYPCSKLINIFENNEKEAVICQSKFSPNDYKIFQKAFFSKKERLDKINKEIFRPQKRNMP